MGAVQLPFMQPSWHTGTQIFPCRVKPVLHIHELFAVKDNYILWIFLMFCWPCQLDALFIFSSFCQSTSTCFRHICSPSSGGILYIYNNWLLYIYSIPPDDGLPMSLKHVEVDWWGGEERERERERINGASSWFSLHIDIYYSFILHTIYSNQYSLCHLHTHFRCWNDDRTVYAFSRLLCFTTIQFGMYQHIFNKNSNYKISWRFPSWQSLCCMQMDKHCDLHSHFYSHFLKVPNNVWNWLWLSSDFLTLYSWHDNIH